MSNIVQSEYTPIVKDGRVIGETIPVSLGTALALEGLINNQQVIEKNTGLFINVRTILRNLVGGFEKKPTKFENGLVFDLFLEEFEELSKLRSNYLPKSWEVIPYLPTYKSMRDIFKVANIKTPRTLNQIETAELERKSFNILHKRYPKLLITDCKINGEHTTSLILTHYPVDLLSSATFRKLSLLESHTGVIKERHKWISKISNKPEYTNLPFNTLTLQLLGDGKSFNSMGIKNTKLLLDLAEKGRWTALTTKDRVKFDIDTMSDKAAAKMFTTMLHAVVK